MLPILLLLHFMLTINYIKSSATAMPLYFYGDEPLQSYLHQFCLLRKDSAELLIIINRLKLNSQNSTDSDCARPAESQLMASYLRGKECQFAHFNDISSRELVRNFKQKNSIFLFKKLHLIFDCTNSQISNNDLRELFFGLSRIHKRCPLCSSFIVLLSGLTKQTLADSLIETKYNFSSVFIVKNNSVIHYRPILDGCYQFEKVYLPKTKHDFARLKVGYKHCNLHNLTLNVSVNDDLPFCHIIQASNEKLVPGYSIEMELLKLLEVKFIFTANLISANKAWGILQNDSWTGVIGQVSNGTSQFGMCELSVTERRLRSVDFTEFLFLDQTTFISQRSGIVGHDWILAGVGNYFWFLNLCSILSVLMTIRLIRWVLMRNEEQLSQVFSYQDILLKLYGIYLRQSTNLNRNASLSSLRLIYAVWVLATLILANSFCTNFFSIITVPGHQRPLDTIEQLLEVARDDSRHLIMVEQSSQFNELLNATEETNRVFHTIGAHINRTSRPRMLADMNDVIGVVENDSRIVAMGTRINLDTRRQLFASMPLHIGSDALDQNYLALPLQKRSPLLLPFNMIIKRMREMGLLDFWLAATIRKVSESRMINADLPDEEENARVLTFMDLSSLYVAWFFGIGLATTNFLFEIVSFIISHHIATKRVE